MKRKKKRKKERKGEEYIERQGMNRNERLERKKEKY